MINFYLILSITKKYPSQNQKFLSFFYKNMYLHKNTQSNLFKSYFLIQKHYCHLKELNYCLFFII